MSWMYSDEELVREMRDQHKATMRHLKEFEKQRKRIVKQLWVPALDKQGQAFIEPKKHAAWRRAVKWNSLPMNIHGQYIRDALDVMRAIEMNGYEAGIKALNDADVNQFGILDLVDKFYHHGHEFSDKYVKSHPEWLKEYPKLSKYLDGKDTPISKEEQARSTACIQESIDLTKNLLDTLSITSTDVSIGSRYIEELDAIIQSRNAQIDAKKTPGSSR